MNNTKNEITILSYLKYMGSVEYEKKDGSGIVTLHKWIDHAGNEFSKSGEFEGEVGKYYTCVIVFGDSNRDGVYKKYWRFTPQEPAQLIIKVE